MKFKLFALCLLTASVFATFSTNVVAKESGASLGQHRRGYILIDPYTGAQNDENCVAAPTGFCWYRNC